MIKFNTKNNIIEWLIANCPRPAIVRSLQDGRVECLGGFSPIPPSTESGWIFRVTGISRTWNVAILAYKHQPKYGIRILRDVPWEYWIGDKYLQDGLYRGDNPDLYENLHDTVIGRKK